MSLDIEGALRSGLTNTTSDDGLKLVGVFFVLNAINGIVAAGAANWPRFGFGGAMASTTPYNVGFSFPPVLAGIISLIIGILTVVVTIGAIRRFVHWDETTLNQDLFTRNVVLAWLNFFIGSIIFGIAVGIGLVLLIAPGVFLLVSLIFWTVFVAVEDQNFIEGFQSSWALVSGHRWMLFGLGVAVFIIVVVVSAIFGGVGGLIRGVIGLLIAQIGGALTTTFSLAVLANAYTQIDSEEPPEEELTEE